MATLRHRSLRTEKKHRTNQQERQDATGTTGTTGTGIRNLTPITGKQINGANVYRHQIRDVETAFLLLSMANYAPPVPAVIDLNAYYKKMMGVLKGLKKQYNLLEINQNDSYPLQASDNTFFVVGNWLDIDEYPCFLYYSDALIHKTETKNILLMCLGIISKKIGFCNLYETFIYDIYQDQEDEHLENNYDLDPEDAEEMVKNIQFHKGNKMTFPRPNMTLLRNKSKGRTPLANWIARILRCVDAKFHAAQCTPYELVDFDQGEPCKIFETHCVMWSREDRFNEYYVSDLESYANNVGSVGIANYSAYNFDEARHMGNANWNNEQLAYDVDMIFDFNLKTLSYYGHYKLKPGDVRNGIR